VPRPASTRSLLFVLMGAQDGWGGGIYVSNGASVRVLNCSISGNRSEGAQVGMRTTTAGMEATHMVEGVFVGGGTVSLQNCTGVQNGRDGR